MCGDDKNCQSAQFMQPVKSTFSDGQLTEPAIYTRKMQSDPKKRQQMQSPQTEDSSVEKVQSQRR